LGRSISQQRAALENFKGVLDARDAQVKVRTADEWSAFEQVLGNVLQGFAKEIQNADVQDNEWETQRDLVQQQRGIDIQGALGGLNMGTGNDDAMMG
jgi:hypothetical protein